MDMRNFGLSDEDLRQLGYKVGRTPDPDGPDESPSGGPGDAAAAPPRRRASPALRIWLASFVVLPVVAWASSLGRGMPAPAPATAPDTAFSSARALAQLVEVAREPHPTGSPDEQRVREVILGRLTALGLEPQVQVTTSFSRDSASVRAATVRNVVARVSGSASTGAVALMAHYDGAPLSPGAGDNGLGVGMLLETARAVTAGQPLRNDLVLVFTDADELGHLGTRAFVGRHPWASDVGLILSVESRGSSGPAMLFESLPANGALVADMAAIGVSRAGTSLSSALRGEALGYVDEQTAPAAPAVALTTLGGRSWDHLPRDTRDRVSERTLQQGGRELLALTRLVGSHDLRREIEGPEQVYLSLPGVGLIHYPRSGVLFTSLGLLVLWGLLGWLIRLRRGRRNGVLGGIGAGAAVVGLSGFASSAVFGALTSVHAEFGFLETAFYRDGPHVLALAFTALAVASLVYGVARRWCRIDEVLWGAFAIPLAVTIWMTFAAPAAAPALQWPLAIAVVAAYVVTLLGPRRGRSAWAWAVVLLLSAALLVLVVPDLQLVTQAWTLRRATALGALFGLTTVTLFPLMDWLQRPKAWATPALMLAAAAALVGLYLPAVQGSVDHPEPTTLVYLTDEAASPGPALPGAAPATDSTRSRTVLGKWLTVPGPGEAWARSWVGEPPTGGTEAGVLLIGFDSLYEVAGTAPDARLAPPRVTVVSSAEEGGRRVVELRVESGIGGEMLGFHVPDGVVEELTGVGDAIWRSGATPVRSLVHWGVPEGGPLRLGMSLAPGATDAELLILEHHLRPRAVLGDYFFQRADSLIANAALGSDRVIQRTDVRFSVVDVTPSSPSGERAAGRQEPEPIATPDEVIRE
jgi:hypothetical protein